MAVLKQLASQTALYGISSVIGRIINWVLTPIFLHALIQQEFGVLSDAFALIVFPRLVLLLGLETAFFRWAEDKHISAQSAYANAMIAMSGAATLFLALGLLLHQPLANVLGYGERPMLIVLILVLIATDVNIAMPLARMRQKEQARRFAFISLSHILLALALNLTFLNWLKLGETTEWVLLAFIIANVFRYALSIPGNWPQFQAFDRQVLREMLGYGAFIMIAGLAWAASETLDRNLLPRLWPSDGAEFKGEVRTGYEMNAIYSAVYKLGIFISLAVQAFRYAAEPFFFKEAKQKNSPSTFAYIFHYYTLAMLVMALGISAFRYEIANFQAFGLMNSPLIPTNYWVGLDVVPILLFANVLLGAYMSLSIWFKLTKQVRYAVLFSGVGAALTLGINIPLIPVFGYYACAWATLAAYSSMAILCYLIGQRHYFIPYKMGRLLLYLLPFGLALWSIELLHDGSAPEANETLIKLGIVSGVLILTVLIERRFPLRRALPDFGAGEGEDAHIGEIDRR